MTENGRYIPAGEGRLAAAFRRGNFPRSQEIAGGVVLLAAGGLGHWLGPQLAAHILGSTRRALGGVAGAEHPGELLWEVASATLGGLLVFVSVILVVRLLATLGPALVFARRRGHTSVPLPQKSRRSPAETMVGGLGAMVFGLIALMICVDLGSVLTRGMLGVSGVYQGILAAFWQIVMAGGVLLVLVGLIQLALMRIRLLETLMLNRSEARQEDRAIRGSPLAKKWMGRSRLT